MVLIMTEKLFYPGQEVICIDKACKPAHEGCEDIPNPVYNELYTISRYEAFRYGMWFVSVIELPYACIYSEDSFAPVAEIGELMECELQLQEV